MSDVTFPYSEKLAANKFGIPRGELREARTLLLEQGADWQKNAGGAVLLSERGLKRLLTLSGNLKGADLSAIDVASLLAEKNGAVAEPATLTVVAICANPRMVLANGSGDPSQDRKLVDVGRNKNFAIGDVIEVAEHEAQQGVWQLVSTLPRTDRRPATQGSLRDPGADWGRNGEEVLRKAKEGKTLTQKDRETLRTEHLIPAKGKKR